MIIILRPEATEQQIQHIIEKAEKLGLKAHISRGVERTIIGFIGPEDVLRNTPLEIFPGVDRVLPVLSPYKLVSREFKKEDTIVTIGKDVKVGGKKVIVVAGPCSIESYDSLLSLAAKVKKAGATVLRGGAFKPRTSPYDFQGLGEEGLKYLAEVGKKVGIATVPKLWIRVMWV